MTRSSSLISIRPKLVLPQNKDQSLIEKFQNAVLRPILKFQHHPILFRFYKDSLTLKSGFHEMNASAKTDYILLRLKSDSLIQKEYIGMIVGLMADEELAIYWEFKKEMDKRIVSMISQRIISDLATFVMIAAP